MVYHALSRANFRSGLFKKEGDYQDFVALVGDSLEFVPMREAEKVPDPFSPPTGRGAHPSGTGRVRKEA